MNVINMDCLEGMRLFPDGHFDSIVTDPPYELGFMGKSWDASGIAYSVEMWREALRVLKPGGHLLAFSGSRTYHRMVCAIEDAGFQIRDCIYWHYGSGFPKSHNLDGEWKGWGTALKPSTEPICVARKPLAKGCTVAANVLRYGTGAINVDGCRVESGLRPLVTSDRRLGANGTYGEGLGGSVSSGDTALGRWPANLIHDGSDEVLAAFPQAAGQQGVAKNDGSPQGNKIYGALRHGTKQPEPRVEPDKSAARFFYCAKASKTDRNEGLDTFPLKAGGMVSNTSGQHLTRRDEGYAPAPVANSHPTVKPTDLMRYLCRLVTPPGGLVLDPFTGSGSTGKAAALEGFAFLGFELSAEYAAIAQARIDAAVTLRHTRTP